MILIEKKRKNKQNATRVTSANKNERKSKHTKNQNQEKKYKRFTPGNQIQQTAKKNYRIHTDTDTEIKFKLDQFKNHKRE